jgi:hypothetical protein
MFLIGMSQGQPPIISFFFTILVLALVSYISFVLLSKRTKKREASFFGSVKKIERKEYLPNSGIVVIVILSTTSLITFFFL